MTGHVPANEQELEQAFLVGAPGVNKFVVLLGATGLRIAFLEEINGRAYHRNAVTMHPQDGMKLRDLLVTVLSDVERQISELEARSGATR